MNGMEVQPSGKKIEDRFVYPLTYEPGSKWTYGPSIDWTGRVIERLNGGMNLESYMNKNICEPLGIKGMTFYLQKRPDMIAKRADSSVRNSEGSGTADYADDGYWHEDPTDAFGGNLHYSWKKSVDLFFEPQLSDAARQSLMKFYEAPMAINMMGSLLPTGVQKDHGLGGILLMEDILNGSWRRKGTTSWSGLPNVFWVSDPSIHVL
ncbi:hypothetical protein MMC25_002315 [Agyrium rufum]|nr:hypothetical protein [Agyrium rufum]